MDICCVQEAKWKGEKAKEISERYIIIIYSRNGVGVILDEGYESKNGRGD